MPISEIFMLILLPLLLGASAFFSGSETALLSLNQHQQKRFAESNGLIGQTITRLTKEYRPLLITLLMGNMLVNVIYINLAALLLLRWNHRGYINAAETAALNIVPLVALIIFSEVIPKIAAVHAAGRWSMLVALPLWTIHRLLTPLRIVSSVLVITPVARLIAPRQAAAEFSVQEMESLLSLSESSGVIDAHEEDLLQQILTLGHLKVSDLMTPRVDIQAFDMTAPPAELIELIRKTRLHHIPVYQDKLDHILGIIFSRQALVKPPQTTEDVNKLLHQVRFIPAQQRADTLLADMRRTGTSLAIVVDEYGGTAGLITIEDVAEHLIGDIPGDYEKSSAAPVQRTSKNSWRARADLSIKQWDGFFANLSAADQKTHNGVSTLGGLVMSCLGHLPKEGETAETGNLKLTVETMNGHRIESVIIQLSDSAANKTKTDTEQ